MKTLFFAAIAVIALSSVAFASQKSTIADQTCCQQPDTTQTAQPDTAKVVK